MAPWTHAAILKEPMMSYLASDDLAVRHAPRASVLGPWLIQALKGAMLALRRRDQTECSPRGAEELIAAQARREEARRRVDRLLLG